MSEKIKKFWDDAELALIQSWYESEKGFLQLDSENNLKAGTLYEIVNSIPDYRGTRRSIGRWLRRQKKDNSATSNVEK